METITRISSPTIGAGGIDTTLPTKPRSFRIISRWSEFHLHKSMETSNGPAPPHGKGVDGKHISILASVVEISRSKIGSTKSKEEIVIHTDDSSSGSTTVDTNTKQPISTVNPEPTTPQKQGFFSRKNTLIAKTRKAITGIRHKFLGPPSYLRGTGKSELPAICSSLAQIPTEEMANPPHLDQSEHFQQEPIKFAVKTLGGKKFKILLPVTQATTGVEVGDEQEQGHGGACDRFIGMLPESCRDISQKASPLGLVPKLLPHGKVRENVRYVASCFWIWLCVVDDLTENLVGRDWQEAESDLMQVFANNVEGHYYSPDSDAIKVSRALRTVIDTTDIYDDHSNVVDGSWRVTFRSAVREVLTGFQAERPLIVSNKIALTEWMRVRMVTISVRPFIVLVKASLGLDPVLSGFGNPLREDYITVSPENRGGENSLAKVECLLQLIMGLQNDILGWEKDAKTNNNLNAIQILAQGGMKPCTAMKDVIGMHNELVLHLSAYGERAWTESLSAGRSPLGDVSSINTPWRVTVPGSPTSVSFRSDLRKDSLMSQRQHSVPEDSVRRYLELIMGFANGMASWMMVSKRYVV